ncbi:MAG: antibiotic biosynthesis monooxygenase [Cyclobacteriaceae bacterium]|nr:antibiotic biosynthesis monooxygenase [Cyclobacteriaceae bacterium HetDA_MAG_MS6]
MLIRIVRMTFKPEEVENFKSIFNEVQPTIADFEGCLHVELLRDSKNTNVFYTLSHWLDEKRLNQYRDSNFFRATWGKTKVLFADKPTAYSLLK